MNVDDAQVPEEVTDDLVFVKIFQKQQTLMEKYGDIERQNGHWYPSFAEKPHIDDTHYQQWLKGMFWRVTEEIAEAFEVFPDLTGNWRSRHLPSNLRHFFEELADALHFLVEPSIVCGITPTEVMEMWESTVEDTPNLNGHSGSIKADAFEFIVAMGISANCLKNKPWKTTQMQTDEAKFARKLRVAWIRFIELWAGLGCSLQEIYSLYDRKNQVNLFRQRSEY